MLFSLINGLEKIDVILASTSPRRYEILKTLGLEFIVIDSKIKEEISVENGPEANALLNTKKKALTVAKKYPGSLVVAADTVVAIDDKIMGKPENEAQAFEMLSLLSGKAHQVYTAFGLVFGKYERENFDCVKTDVYFRKLSEDEVWAYINTGEPFDKAGAYGIQGQGAVLVERVDGCYYNVVGFPLSRFFQKLDSFLSHIVL